MMKEGALIGHTVVVDESLVAVVCGLGVNLLVVVDADFKVEDIGS
jgi:hypothetical protein